MQHHRTEAPDLSTIQLEGDQTPLPYDTLALKELAMQRRIDAARVVSEAMRAFYLNEAERCEQRLRKSLFTPIIRGWDGFRPTDQIETMAVTAKVA